MVGGGERVNKTLYFRVLSQVHDLLVLGVAPCHSFPLLSNPHLAEWHDTLLEDVRAFVVLLIPRLSNIDSALRRFEDLNCHRLVHKEFEIFSVLDNIIILESERIIHQLNVNELSVEILAVEVSLRIKRP